MGTTACTAVDGSNADRGRRVLWGTSACEEEVRSGALSVRARAFRA